MGHLVGIARRDEKRAPMQELQSADVSEASGVAHDSRGKPGNRQVTVMSADAWRDVCAELQHEIPWTTRRANLLVEGVDLLQSIGAIIDIGNVRLQVTMEAGPCSRMDEQFEGLTGALQAAWRGGVGCTVVQAGSLAVGDSVSLQVVD